MRRILIVPVIAGLLLALSACGAKEETSTAPTTQASAKSSDSDQSSTTEKTETTDPDSGDSTDEDGDTGGIPDLPTALDDECMAVGTLYAGVMAQAAAVFNPAGVSDEELEKLADQFEKAKAQVPDEIADAFETWSVAWAEYMEALSELSDGGMTNPANLEKLEKANEIIEAPEVKAATDEIDAYLDKECGNG